MKKTLKNLDLLLISQLVLGIIILLIGILVMIFKSFGLTDIVMYISILFYACAFFSIITYFIRRKEGDYELLLLALINIITATFMYVLRNDNVPMILGSGMTVYTILLVANRGYKIISLKNLDNFMWIVKFIITFLISFLGILTTYNLFNEVTVQTMMFGYYFISLGLLLTIENVVEIFISNNKFKKIVNKVIDEPKKDLEEIKEVKEEKESSKKEGKVATKKQTTKQNKEARKPKESTKREGKETTKTPTKKVSKVEKKTPIKKESKKTIGEKKTVAKPKKTTTKQVKKTNIVKSSDKNSKAKKINETKKVEVKKVGRPKKSN